MRLALWLDRHGARSEASRNFGTVLRLFGLEQVRDGQLPVVEAALNGQSVLVVSPTGFGKTLCFQLPTILRQGVSVVVCPLKALMGEQVSALLRLKIPSTFINSDLDRDEKQLRYSFWGIRASSYSTQHRNGSLFATGVNSKCCDQSDQRSL